MGGATELEPGEVFVGRYEIRRLLGQGDRKQTYLAFDKKMDRLVAISFVKPEAARDDPEGTEREAAAWSECPLPDEVADLCAVGAVEQWTSDAGSRTHDRWKRSAK